MKNLFKGAFVLSLFAKTNAQNAEQPIYEAMTLDKEGDNCSSSVKISCAIKEPGGPLDGEDCSALVNQECAFRTLQYTFKYCNKNVLAIDPIVSRTKPRVDNDVQTLGLRLNRMAGNECRELVKVKTYDTCAIGQAAAGMTLNAWVEDKYRVNPSWYCYSYHFLKFKLRKKTGSGTTIPLPSISLAIQTEFEPISNTKTFVSTSQLSSYAPTSILDCLKKFKTIYTITNTGFDDVILGGLIDGNNDNILQSDDMGATLEIDGVKTVYQYEDIDICRLNGESLPVMATAIASSPASSLPATAAVLVQRDIPDIAPKLESGTPAITCLYNGMDCIEYAILNGGCWAGEADFEYVIEKADLGCHGVDEIDIVFDNGVSKRLAHIEDYVCTSKTFCHGNTWVLREKRFVDLCDLFPGVDPPAIPITIGFDFDDIDEKEEVYLEYSSDAIMPGPTPAKPSPVPTPAKPNPAPTPAKPSPAPTPANPEPTAPTNKIPHFGTPCTKRADKLWFEFTGGACDGSDNDQMRRMLKKKKNTFACVEDGDFNTDSGEFVIDVNGVEMRCKEKGEHILVEDGPTNMYVKITAPDGATQTFNLHSSCSGSFKIGDTFGALTFVGFENEVDGNKYAYQG